jgi:capsular exopolysaccharide synthesis family protein
MVTSAQPQEGKTVTSMNIAISLTQIGKRVLVLDADLRKPRVHKILEVARTQGLSSFLAGNVPWRDLILPTPVPGLFALTAGPIPPNPAELLASKSFRSLLEDLRRSTEFDHVIIDTPPLLAVADPIIVSEQVDGVLLVVKAGETPRQSVAAGLEKLRAAKARVLGAILNNLDLTGHDAYAYRYGYRYGYDDHPEGEVQPGDDRSAVHGQGGRT